MAELERTPHPFAVALADYASAHRLFDPVNDEEVSLLVAFSGGPDSTALLLALLEARDAGLPVPRSLVAAHFHHGLRGVDADEDAAFAAGLCARHGVPCTIGLGSVSTGKRLSPNDAARRARYAFLEETAREMGANGIVTAHTADDQAETVLLRVLRGTGVDGLAGIPVHRILPSGLVLIRPLLGARRSEVEDYCRDRGVTPRRDPSNVKDRYARSRLRKRLPELADAFNPRLVEALGRLAGSAAADADLLGSLAESLWERAAHPTPEGVRLDSAALLSEHPALRRRVLLRALRHVAMVVGSEGEAATSDWVESLASLLLSGRGRLSLPGNLRAEREAGYILLTVPPIAAKSETPASVPLPIPGSVSWIDGTISARPRNPGEGAAPRLRRALEVDIALDPAVPLVVRAARIGERIAPLGMSGKTRLIRDLLSDAGVPAAARDLAPVVARADTGEVLWLVGIAQSESTRLHSDTDERGIVRLTLTRFEEPSPLSPLP